MILPFLGLVIGIAVVFYSGKSAFSNKRIETKDTEDPNKYEESYRSIRMNDLGLFLVGVMIIVFSILSFLDK